MNGHAGHVCLQVQLDWTLRQDQGLSLESRTLRQDQGLNQKWMIQASLRHHSYLFWLEGSVNTKVQWNWLITFAVIVHTQWLTDWQTKRHCDRSVASESDSNMVPQCEDDNYLVTFSDVRKR